MKTIIRKEALTPIFSEVDTPARYTGGEFGSIQKGHDAHMFHMALSFPDLYEIGMSNLAMRILYSRLNSSSRIACERVFAAAPDFERMLREADIPLFTLESRYPLYEMDLIGFSFGYELLATNVLQILDLGKVPFRRDQRTESDPIVVAGGPGITNPVPLGPLFDGVYIGEAEAGFLETIEKLAQLKESGAGRTEQLRVLHDQRSVWYSGRLTPVQRAVWAGFGRHEAEAGFPVPNFRVAHDHGVVEIMRGCPQGCRFCHAGIHYRPYRMKSHEMVEEEVSQLVDRYGYRDITLSSLSSGDYAGIDRLLKRLNDRFSSRGVSFQLPSLRIDSFTLGLLEQLSVVKRAGLTFAIETADPLGQRAVNKLVPLEKTISILREAYAAGWRRAKFYFMVGLPVPGKETENEAILSYVRAVLAEVPVELNINIGTFIPKPHTPFQWSRQFDDEEARTQLHSLKKSMPKGVKLNYHDPFLSLVEGIIARGDDRTWPFILDAYTAGARLDAWDEYVRKDIWRDAIDAHPGVLRSIGGFATDEVLPWDGIRSGVPKPVLLREYARSKEGILTERCRPDCAETCGVCNPVQTVIDLDAGEMIEGGRIEDAVEPVLRVAAADGSSTDLPEPLPEPVPATSLTRRRLLIRYSRNDSVAYLSHLATLRLFERVWYRAGIAFPLTEGFSPKPKFSFSQPLPVGMTSNDEYVILNIVQNTIQLEKLSHNIQSALPAGFLILESFLLESDRKIPSPMELFAGARYRIGMDLLSAAERMQLSESLKNVSGVTVASGTRHDGTGDSQDGEALLVELRAGIAPGINKLLRKLIDSSVLHRLNIVRERSFAFSESESKECIPYEVRYKPITRESFLQSGPQSDLQSVV